MFKARSGVCFKAVDSQKVYEFVANWNVEEYFLNNTESPECFYLDDSTDIGSLILSLEDATKLRDYLNEMIEFAEANKGE